MGVDTEIVGVAKKDGGHLEGLQVGDDIDDVAARKTPWDEARHRRCRIEDDRFETRGMQTVTHMNQRRADARAGSADAVTGRTMCSEETFADGCRRRMVRMASPGTSDQPKGETDDE